MNHIISRRNDVIHARVFGTLHRAQPPTPLGSNPIPHTLRSLLKEEPQVEREGEEEVEEERQQQQQQQQQQQYHQTYWLGV